MLKYILLLLLPIAACTPKSDDVGEKAIPPINFDERYQTPSFSDPERINKFKATIPEIDSIFKNHAEENHYPGLVYALLVDGEIIHQGQTGVIHLDSKIPVSSSSAFHIASMTKSFTSMAIVKLRDEGKLDLEDPVVNYISELDSLRYPTSDAPHITIKNLMTMSSGFPEDNPWADRQLEESNEAFLKMLEEGIPFSNLPSTSYEYSNLGYAMLGFVISKVTGSTYQKYITDEILLPLGMSHTYWEYEDVPEDKLAVGYRWEEEQWKEEPLLHTGAFGSIGGLITTLDDFSKYVAYIISAYPPRNDPESGPVKRSTLREMQRPTFPRLITGPTNSEGDPCPEIAGYAYGLGYRNNCDGIIRISHSGGLPGYGSEYRMYPDYGFAIISFANRTYAGTGGANSAAAEKVLSSGIQMRQLEVSDILAQRQQEVAEFLSAWEDKGIFAENFFLDQSLELRKKDYDELLSEAGDLSAVGPIIPWNQLRGTFMISGEFRDIQIVFTLSPESNPKVQGLYFRTVDKGFSP